MAVYGPSTGHYSSQSIRTARKTGGKGGSKLSKNSSGKWVNTPDTTGYEKQLEYGKGGYYSGSGNGGYSGSSDYGGGSYQDLIDKSYQQRRQALQDSINNAVTKNESNITNVNRSAEEANNSAYVSRELAKSQTPETMSAMGMSGGASESAMLGLNTNFENSRNATNQNRQNSLDQIYQNSADIRGSGNTALANLGADYSQQMAAALQQQQAMQMQKDAQDRENQLAIIGASSNDYMAKINQIRGDNDPTNDWLIPYYDMARNDKMSNQQKAEQEAAEKEREWTYKDQQMELNWYKANKSGRSSSGSGGGYTNKTDAYNASYVDVLNGNVSPEQIEQKRNSIIATYGRSKYDELLELAQQGYKGAPVKIPKEFLLTNVYGG